MLLGKYLPLSMLSELEVEFWVGPNDDETVRRRPSVCPDTSSFADVGGHRDGVAA